MRFFMFLISSSLLIGLVVLIRKLFRKTLAPGVIYALWLIPLLRLLIPFGGWEFPAVGAAADFFNMPYALTAGWMDEGHAAEKHLSNEEAENTWAKQEEPAESTGIKVYDAVIPEKSKQMEAAPDFVKPLQKNNKVLGAGQSQRILMCLWVLGSVMLGGYVIHKNCQLNKMTKEMEPAEEIEGIRVCVSDRLSVPCLFGLRSPKILVPREIYLDQNLYGYALQHELAHFHQKDHFWTAMKLLICVIYWWNPFVWLGARCVEEDAELACDSKALKGQMTAERKMYGYALLQMLGNAKKENQHLCAATSMGGGRKSMKRRIEEISQKTSTKKQVLFPVILVLLTVLVLGCGSPTNKSWMQEIASEYTADEEKGFSELELEFESVFQNDMQSRLFYYEVYEYGELTERQFLSYGNINEAHKSTTKIHWEMKPEGQTLTWETDGEKVEGAISIPQYVAGPGSGGILFADNEKLEIKPGDDLILMADYRPQDDQGTEPPSPEELSVMTEGQLKESLQDIYLSTFLRMKFSDLPEEELYALYEEQEYPPKEKLPEYGKTAFEAAETWANAFSERNAARLIDMADENLRKVLSEESGILDEETPYFGWSSPWPMFTEKLYDIVSCNDTGAEIVYYATDSTPHVWVWRETLEFKEIEGKMKVVSETLHMYDIITSAEDFRAAYPDGIEGTMMDYTANGLGEALNENALREAPKERELDDPGRSVYQQLFSPETAAAELLNITTDKETVSYSWEDTGDTATVQINFLKENGNAESVEVTMWQPYGEDGIWIPK